MSNQNNEIKFSFIVPVYDRTQKLRESIRSLLRQTYNNYEIILVCDGSPESTMQVIEEFSLESKVKVFKFQNNSGNACRGRNRAISMATGDFVCFHDSDDIAHHERLNRTYEVIKHTNADGVYGSTKILLDGSRSIDGIHNGQLLEPPEFDYEILKKVNLMMTCSVSVRRKTLLRYGGFRPEMKYREDHELWLRLAFNGCNWKKADGLLCYYRVHAGNAELVLRDNDDHWFEQALYWHTREY